MAKRAKKIILSGVTREAMEEAFGRYATADAEMQSINAAMDKEFVAIRERNAERLAELEQQKTESFEVMQVFATEQREVLFSKRRSLETTHGIIGFRTGTPKLKTRRGFTWAAALELVREFLPSYIRISEEVAKDKLLADRENEQLQPLMQKCGIDVVQEESFYVEPKKEKED
ncbi:host-nuclease inhibitor Gam family protein [uncultured Alistipes sp.]|uniref:host-nuclease inhibitor Gam family protein n=1 Tax=uncultured Alistipes sp. TaxID=538949 RepID=UPI0026668F59|nr:host-nuclease inhibitor Gam family protein [uncultured Alistipes sp.]